jgi:hypothetical protein
MPAPQIAPYGTWKSPVTTAVISRQIPALGAMHVDGDTLYWQEVRPAEGGRWALMRWRPG